VKTSRLALPKLRIVLGLTDFQLALRIMWNIASAYAFQPIQSSAFHAPCLSWKTASRKMILRLSYT